LGFVPGKLGWSTRCEQTVRRVILYPLLHLDGIRGGEISPKQGFGQVLNGKNELTATLL